MAIRRRIIQGYVIVLGITLTGVVGGVCLGNIYQHNARQLRREVATERQVFNQLRIDILRNRPANQLSPYLSDPEGLAEAGSDFLHRLDQIEMLLHEYHQLHIDHPATHFHADETHRHNDNTPVMHSHDSKDEVFDVHSSLLQFEGELAVFQQKLETFLAWMAENPPETSRGLAIAETRLLELDRSPEFSTFVSYVDELEPFLLEISRREILAEMNVFWVARLRNYVVLGSLVLSFLFALFLAMVTSRAIAKPISEISRFAHQITESESFNQSIHLEGDEEIETLSNAFNQLIHQVYLLLNTINKQNMELAVAFEQLQEQQVTIVQSEKMSSLGELVAGVAHEINNPVNFIHGNVHHARIYLQDLLGLIELYQSHYPEPDAEIAAEAEAMDLDFVIKDFPKMLDSMGLGTRRIRDIVLSLRSFSRVDANTLNEVNIHEGIDSTLVILNHRLKEKSHRPAIKVTKNYGALPMIEGFPGQLNQVFMNILSNAIDALEETNVGRSFPEIEVNPNHIEIITAVIPGDRIEIRIKDNGKGMSAAVKEKLFNLFFTTKDMGKGTGIGMAISHQIVTENHHGEITVNSACGLGAEFILTLPIHQRPIACKIQSATVEELAIAS